MLPAPLMLVGRSACIAALQAGGSAAAAVITLTPAPAAAASAARAQEEHRVVLVTGVRACVTKGVCVIAYV